MKRWIALVLCLCLTMSLVACDTLANLLIKSVAVEGTWNLEVVDLPDEVAEELFEEILSSNSEGEEAKAALETYGITIDAADFVRTIFGSISLTFKENGNFIMTTDGQTYADAMYRVSEATFDAMADWTPEKYVEMYGDGTFDAAALREALAAMGTTWEDYLAELIEDGRKELQEEFTPEAAAEALGHELNDDGTITLLSGTFTVRGDQVSLSTVDKDGDTQVSTMTLNQGDSFFSVISLDAEDGSEVEDSLVALEKYSQYFRLVKAPTGEIA